MPRVTFLDSVVLIGAFLENDSNHETAKPIVDGIDLGHLPKGVINEYIYAEIGNYLNKSNRVSLDEIRDIFTRLHNSKNIRIYHSNQDHFDKARNDIYFEYNSLSMVDSISVAFMNDKKIEYIYTLDDGFDRVNGISKLEDAINPF